MPDQLLNLYPTPLLKRRLEGMEDVNRQLTALILEMEVREPNAADGTTTQGGYQTREDLLAHDHALHAHPALVSVKEHITTALWDFAGIMIRQECTRSPTKIDFVMWGWAVLYRAGDAQGLHVHPGAHISGVYYVSAPPVAMERGEPGKISFYDPRPRAHMNQLAYQGTRHREPPVPGDMVLFPSYLEHSVTAFQGEGLRICIAFNAQLMME
jgi:uncharacterized protein (TIGR02466 family)